MHYAHAMHAIFDPANNPSNTVGWACVFVLSAAYALAIAHGVVSIDVARDLFWGQQITRGEALPLLGPPVGSTTFLGAVWYYVVATVLSVSVSLTTYGALIGLLCASKFVLAYVVGRRWLGTAFGISLAVASAAPGVASYQMLGIGHPWFIEATLWLAAWCALRLRAAPKQSRWAFGLGAAAALAMHAHPTAIVLLPWALVAVVALPVNARLRALVGSAVGASLVFLPWLLATFSPSLIANSAADNAIGPNGIGGSIAAVAGIAQNLLWTQAKNIFDSLLPHTIWGTRLALTLWAGVLIATVIGMLIATRDARLRGTLLGSLLSSIWTVTALALLRDHTPFYMTFVALLPLSALLAVAWVALLGDAARLRRVTWLAVLLTVIVLHAATAAGFVNIARNGQVDSYLPLHSNMQDVSTTRHQESVLAVTSRDALARWLCAQPGQVSLHGDIASAFDVGLRHETDLACREQKRRDDVGGKFRPQIGLPNTIWRQLKIRPEHDVGAYGLASAQRVLSPASALIEASGRRYPPRHDLMIAASKQAAWSVSATLPPTELLVVSSLLPTMPFFTATAAANGVDQRAIVSFANTEIFRCEACAKDAVEWSIKIRGGLPETVSITTVSATSASGTILR